MLILIVDNEIINRVKALGITINTPILAIIMPRKIGFFEIEPVDAGNEIFRNQNTFYQFHTEGFELPDKCQLLAKGEVFKNQAFKHENCYALQFHPEVNFIVHLRWIFLVLFKKPKILFHKGSQNLFYQLYLRYKHNKSVSLWLDSFLDNYLLAHK